MIDKIGLNLRTLERVYLLANVPSYLIRHYRNDASLQEFAKKNTTADLFSLATEIAQRPNRTLNEIAQAYAALVALTFKNSTEVHEARKHASLDGIVWADQILAWADSQKTANQQVRVLAPSAIIKSPVQITNAANELIQLEMV